jgi:cytosine deaminase
VTQFSKLEIPAAAHFVIRNARVLDCFLDTAIAGTNLDNDGAGLLDVSLVDGKIAALVPSSDNPPQGVPTIDLQGRHLWPTLIDMHTHIDKGQIIGRLPPHSGTFAGARQAINNDRKTNWSRDDIYHRMDFALRCAYVHGVSAIRTHIDSYEGLAEDSWEAFKKIRDVWQGRILLQAVASVPIDVYRSAYGVRLADLVAAAGGLLGGVTRSSQQDAASLLPDLDELLDLILKLAGDRGLGVDLHVDETGDPEAASLERVAQASMRNRFKGRIVCGHCCSLSVQPEELVRRTLDRCADAGIAIVTMPVVNMYLHDREPGRTPRWRGATLAHEIRHAGIPLAVGSDNCRDPFHPYGDYDMFDTFRQAVRVQHLDHTLFDAPSLVGPTPGQIIEASPLGMIRPGSDARLIIFNARSLNELMCRPQSDRIVLDRAKRVTDALPDFAELDIAR